MMTLKPTKTKGQSVPLRKTHRAFLLLATGALLATASSSVQAQGSFHVDTSGHPTALLNLGDAHVTGTLDPARLPPDAAFRTLNVSDQILLAGPLNLPANQPITLSGDDISGSILTIGTGGVFTPLPLPAGQSIRRNAANTAFEAYAPNTSDGSTLLNLSAAAISTGTVPPARLGTGTPSSATVLRGDGTWAGTTATGNTIAATGNLLLGDGAGNARAVASGTDLLRVLQTRLETMRATTTQPANLLLSAIGTNAVVNTDGTVTIPANGEIYWHLNGQANQTVSAYAAAVQDVPAGAFSLFWHAGYDHANTSAAVLPSVIKDAFLVPGNGDYEAHFHNTMGTPLVIYFPFLATADAGLAALQSYADFTPVTSQPVSNLDFTQFASDDRTSRYGAEKQTTVAVDSVSGLDANAGTLYAPKLTLGQTLSNGSALGIYRGSSYRASLPVAGQGNGRGIVVQDLAFGSPKALPIISGLDLAPNGSFTANGDGTYSYLWTPTDSTLITSTNYDYAYVVEIDTAAEAATPVASRHHMVDTGVLATINSQSAVAARAGSALLLPAGTGAGQSGSTTRWKAVIHPSDGLAPGSGTYRYEVVSRVAPSRWYTGNSVGDGLMSGLQLFGGSAGYGPLSGPTGFVGDRLVVAHGTTHNAVLGGGSLQRSVLYEMGANTSIMLAWYANDPTGLSWDLRHCLFYGQAPGGITPPNFVIAHSGGGAAYTRGDISDCAFLAGRLANGALGGMVYSPNNIAQTLMDRCYAYGVASLLGTNFWPGLEIKRSVFRQVSSAIMPGSFHDNVVACESQSDPDNAIGRGTLGAIIQSSATGVQNNLFWLHATNTSGLAGDDSARFLNANGYAPNVTRNIVVLDAPATGVANYANFGANASLPTMDYNLVIQVGGTFAVNFPGSASWADYVANSGHGTDQHSLYVDLRGDPRGLQAVFADPAHGDFRWAQTDVASRCAAYCLANHVGPATATSHWPVVPTVDEAVRLLTDL